MKNKKISIKTIIILVLIVIIIGLISIILNMKNKNIVGQELIKEQLEEKTTDNAYISMFDHLLKINNKQKELDNVNDILNNLNTKLGQSTVTEDKILKDYTAYKDGKLITGTMANNGAVTKILNAGESYAIAAGYHNGSGKVTANSLASQTSATATANNITTGKTAWVNGKLITGNGADNIVSRESANFKAVIEIEICLGDTSTGKYTTKTYNITLTKVDGNYTCTPDSTGYFTRYDSNYAMLNSTRLISFEYI